MSEAELEASNAPLLVVDQDGWVQAHDGRHRAVRYGQKGMDMPVLLIGSTPDVDVTKVKTLQSQKFGDKTRGANVVPDHTKFVEQQDEETKGNIVLDGIWGNQRGGSPEITEASKGLSKAMKATLRIAKSAKQSLTDWLDVEARFKRKGHHKTGLAVKNFFGRKTARQVQGVQKAREFMENLNSLFSKSLKITCNMSIVP